MTASGSTDQRTILIDSAQLESGEPLGAEFKKDAAREIDELQEAYRLRNPGADVEKLTDADLLREAMNTIGKNGKLGEHIRCVVSVAMLTEGWDANTVTHILGIRPFRSQLLCEQVVGRGLRRRSYAANEDRPLRARVRRGLRRAVRIHPERQGLTQAATTPAPPSRSALSTEKWGYRDPLPEAGRLPGRAPRRAANRRLRQRIATAPRPGTASRCG